jgi:putative endonuclease
MPYFVYMLLTKNKEKFLSYVGYTNNLKKRLSLHNSSKGAKFTRGKRWRVIYQKKYSNKSNAMRDEYKLKKDYKLRNKIKEKFIKNEKRYFYHTSL